MHPRSLSGDGLNPKDMLYDSTFYYYNKSIQRYLDLDGDGEMDEAEKDSSKILLLHWRSRYSKYIKNLDSN